MTSKLTRPYAINKGKQIFQLRGCDERGLTIIHTIWQKDFYPDIHERPRPKNINGQGSFKNSILIPIIGGETQSWLISLLMKTRFRI